MAEATRRKLSDDEQAALKDLTKRKRDQEGKARSARTNASSYQAFVEECDARIAAGDTSDNWDARKRHTLASMIPQAQADAKISDQMAAIHEKALEAEKAGFKNLVEDADGNWSVDP